MKNALFYIISTDRNKTQEVESSCFLHLWKTDHPFIHSSGPQNEGWDTTRGPKTGLRLTQDEERDFFLKKILALHNINICYVFWTFL